ncbi:IQ calmodulin-binding motif-containing protein 1 [Mytilus galloprovincialis]|uniref:IQ calmodulin-binding motif-containing protein 1 n=1 Tax=Mytilus galloprovincialis TaxID=29158 RepID=A0A8B6CPT6_MYTGA|nr:IQ calmodulin-binding motif-containing protein 1 [Mytilus galloprovincialis]
MSRQPSPTRDKRVINLASEVAETRDRRIPILLLRLKEILSTAVAGSKDGMRIRKEIWEYNLLQALVLVLKQDFSIVDGEWQIAASLAAILSQVCTGLDLPSAEVKKFEDEVLLEAVSNMFLVTRRIQARYAKIPDRAGHMKERNKLLACYRGVLESIVYLASGHTSVPKKVLECPWLLQLLITDDTDTVVAIMDLIPKILRVNRIVLRSLNQKLILSIMDELIYKLSVSNEVSVGASACKCVLRICENHRPLVETLCTRYKGLRPLLAKWEGAGFSRDLKEIHLLLQAGNAQKAENERFFRAAITIQAVWKGFITRKKLVKANKTFSKFQQQYRLKKRVLEERKVQAKEAIELQRQLKLNRQRIMREFKEKQLHTVEILPAAMLERYMQRQQNKSAVLIQKSWRGHHARNSMQDREVFVKRYRAAITVQRGVRKWLKKLEDKRNKIKASLKPPGLTDDRRVEIQRLINQNRELKPTVYTSREELEQGHKKAAEMLARYYQSARVNREKQHHREALIARLNVDSELVHLAPPLNSVTDKDVEMYSSNLLPVATKAKNNHIEQLRLLRQPWWKKLCDEYQDQEYVDDEQIIF